VTAGGSVFMKILNGLLAAFVATAFLVSYFDQHDTRRRSTDEDA